jgi:DNA end-binding protein Ku
MVKRPIWKGAIAFGMVSIPVNLFAATVSKDLSLHLLHRECLTRLKELRWCPLHERAIPPEEIVRGYEYAKGQYVVLAEEDLASLPIPSKHTIALSAFVKAAAIDPVFYNKSYYLEPDTVGVKPYALLLRALRDKQLAALARVTLRTRERLCALRPFDGTIVMETLFHADEVRVPARLEMPKVDLSDQELAMAFNFIDLLSSPFQPAEYEDTYRAALQRLIEAKLQGQPAPEAPAPSPAKVVDLMAALKASVDAAKQRQAGQAAPEKGRKLRKAG